MSIASHCSVDCTGKVTFFNLFNFYIIYYYLSVVSKLFFQFIDFYQEVTNTAPPAGLLGSDNFGCLPGNPLWRTCSNLKQHFAHHHHHLLPGYEERSSSTHVCDGRNQRRRKQQVNVVVGEEEERKGAWQAFQHYVLHYKASRGHFTNSWIAIFPVTNQ